MSNMGNYCKDCDRLQPKTSGSAPIRAPFDQPTMYDHFANFQRYKQVKQEEQYLRARKEELSKFNTNFTDWQLNATSSRDEFDQFSTQDIARYRQQVRAHNNCDRSVIDNATKSDLVESTNSSPREVSLKKKVSLLTISRTPVVCPIGTCGRTIGATSVLSHYLRDHNEDIGLQCQEIHGGKRSVLVFDASSLNFRENICLAVLAYGGVNMSSSDRPADRGICMNNAFLPKPHEHLDAHLPILIMACKTSWSAMLGDKKYEAKVTNPTDKASHLLVLWLVGIQTTKPIHCTLSVYDKAMTSSRSTIIQVRHLNESQNPSEFLHCDTNCLRLCNGEIDILSHGGSELIQMEVMINEFDQ